MSKDLTRVETHFAFGKNWESFLDSISEERLAEAVRGLERLFPNDEVRGSRFLDIGCGSGLSMLAALRLGAASVTGVDADADSVAASHRLLGTHASGEPWTVKQRSVFEMTPETDGTFDLVYSWGVLHHTGAMWDALRRAAGLVTGDGAVAIALYRSTPMDGFWKLEKKVYSSAPAFVQAPIRWLYEIASLSRAALLGQNPIEYVKRYGRKRGMSWYYDVHDWLGGYPYETQRPKEVAAALAKFRTPGAP